MQSSTSKNSDFCKMPPSHRSKPKGSLFKLGALPGIQRRGPLPLSELPVTALPPGLLLILLPNQLENPDLQWRHTKGHFTLHQFQLAFGREMKEMQKTLTKTFWLEMCWAQKTHLRMIELTKRERSCGGDENMLYLDCGRGYDFDICQN